MAKRRAQRRDAMDRILESALEPGRFIGWNEGSSFVSGLYHVVREIESITAADPGRAANLYETLLAGCDSKMEEVDDSDGAFGIFAGGLVSGWIRARQAAGANRGETARQLCTWMESDDYGIFNDVGRCAPTVLDRAGLESFELEVQARFEAAWAAAIEPKAQAHNYACGRWAGILRSIYAAQGNVQKYIDVTHRTEMTQADCEALASMLQAKRKPEEALEWVERGLRIERRTGFGGHKLAELRRALLVRLGRGGEALDSAWADFQEHPSTLSYRELLRFVPKAERGAWHDKAMTAAEGGDLGSLIDLWISAKEIERLARRLDAASDRQLENLSHYVSEPAAKSLARSHPAVAARVYGALCVRILDAGKSKYYSEALSNIEKAKECYERAGLEAQWQAVVSEIRREHYRKTGFMPGFERILRGAGAGREASFLDRARSRWAKRG